jgi:toxin ParE1/3/4
VNADYVIRPKADEDLDHQAFYLAEKATAEVGHRFLVAAHETFTLLASQPEMGWHPRLKHTDLASLRTFRISGFERMIVLYRPITSGVEILRVIHGSQDLIRLLRREGIE